MKFSIQNSKILLYLQVLPIRLFNFQFFKLKLIYK